MDVYRPPYARRSIAVPRQTVFIATTNEAEYLRDATGNRRFWPVRCGRIDFDAVSRDRDQLWAEAVHFWQAGEAWHLTAEETEATRISIASPDENPEELLEARELGREIERAIGMLRAEYRTAVILRHVEGRAYEEIAEIMDVPLGTVKTYIHRARNDLKKQLEHLRA
jgi:RNA polymerase sigma factor (sigma-70 family)